MVLDPAQLSQRTETVRSRPRYAAVLGLNEDGETVANAGHASAGVQEEGTPFEGAELEIARLAWAEFRRYEAQPDHAPTSAAMLRPDIQKAVLAEVERRWRPDQLELTGVTDTPIWLPSWRARPSWWSGAPSTSRASW